jgi:hypothetical protein
VGRYWAGGALRSYSLKGEVSTKVDAGAKEMGRLYAAGPECRGSSGKYYSPRGDQRCIERTNIWERISGAITG